jgi:hypothetical protein
MQPLETGLLYVVAGVAVGVAFLVRSDVGASRVILALASVAFWPLLVPALVAPRKARTAAPRPTLEPSSRLAAALAGLDGVAGELAIPEIARVRGHAASAGALEGRLQEMDVMLRTPEFDEAAAQRTLADLGRRGLPETDARVLSVRGRIRNIQRLRSLRDQSAENLERVCLQIEEITAQLKLLRFAGRSTTEEAAVAAIRQAAQAMQSLTEAMLPAEPEGQGAP